MDDRPRVILRLGRLGLGLIKDDLMRQEDVITRLIWQDQLRFEATTDGNRRLLLDGDNETGFSPMGALLTSLCGCMAIDVVLILGKMKQPVKQLEVLARGQRRPDPPRYFEQVEVEFRIGGPIDRPKIDRAIQLSLDKYCSVLHSLRPDLKVDCSVVELQSDDRTEVKSVGA